MTIGATTSASGSGTSGSGGVVTDSDGSGSAPSAPVSVSSSPGPIGTSGSFASLEPVVFTQKNEVASARACVKLDGRLYGIKSYRISKNAHGATNTASFKLPYAGNPDWTRQLFRDSSVQGTAGNKPVYAEIWAGFPPNPGMTPSIDGLSKRFSGIVDTYHPDDMNDTEFQLRSIAAPLTTDRITTAVQNLTTVEFLKQIAAPYSIPVVIDPELTNPFTLPKIYAQEFVVGLKNLIKWDVLLRSSIFDDVDVWEDDGTLYYVHPWNVQSVMASQAKSGGRNYGLLNLQYGTNVKSFHPSHSPQFSRNIRVQVHSYSAKSRVSVTTRVQSVIGGINVKQVIKTSTATPQWGTNGGTSTTYNDDGSISHSDWTSSGGSASGSNAAISESGLELYDFYIPNLDSTECQLLCQALWREISQHEYAGDFTVAVRPSLLPYLNIENRFNLNGYGMSLFNTQYWPRTLDETFEMADSPGETSAGGWTVTSHAVSHTLPLGSV